MHQNIHIIQKKLGYSSDLVCRKIMDISYIYLESLTNDKKISNYISKSIINNTFGINNINNKINSPNIIELSNLDDAYYYILSGFTIVFQDKNIIFWAVETRESLDRSITESTSEPILRGPKDSFNENYNTNIGLIRKRIKDKSLRVNEIKLGEKTQNKVGIIYLNDLVNLKLLNKIINYLNQIKIDGLIDSGYIREYLEKNTNTSFPTIITTERPDLTCQSILNGKITIIVENSPIILILPATLSDFFKIPEDYYQKPLNATISRILRYIALIITIITPAFYIALMTYNQEMIPDQLLISLASQRTQIPFPTFIEVMIYIIIFEMLRQADIRSPNIAGASMSIVGALILGDAAVNAGLVSPMVIIVVSLTSICELIFNNIDFNNAIRQWRMLFIISTIFTGLIGFLMGIILLIIKLASIENNNVPYLTPLSPLNKNLFVDGLVIKAKTRKEQKKWKNY